MAALYGWFYSQTSSLILQPIQTPQNSQNGLCDRHEELSELDYPWNLKALDASVRVRACEQRGSPKRKQSSNPLLSASMIGGRVHSQSTTQQKSHTARAGKKTERKVRSNEK